ncbi:MAG: C2 family cysteine protease [archaeon]|nr:C2 family cysteine protease [archaeon]
MSINLTEEELGKLKVLADFVFYDEYQDKASYPQFEQTFAAFFKDGNVSLEKAFKALCGDKRKYLNFKRMIKAFLKAKDSPSEIAPEAKTFYSSLMDNFLKDLESTIGDKNSKGLIKQSSGSKNRCFISKFGVMTDSQGIIKGLKLQYDDLKNEPLYDTRNKDLKENLSIEMDVLDEAELLKNQISSANEFLFRDYITQIFGTMTNKIEFLGITLRSGKTYGVGNPIGTPFLYGGIGYRFHYCKIRIGDDGVTYFEPHFADTPRVNDFLKVNLNEITFDYLNNDPPINEEEAMDKIEDQETLDKFLVAAPIVSDNIKEETENKGEEKMHKKDIRAVIPREEKESLKEPKKKHKKAEDLSVEDILGESTKDLETRKRKKKMKPEKILDDPAKYANNRKNYRELMNRVGQNIQNEIDREKEKLNERIEAPPVAEGGVVFEEKNEERKLSPPRVRNINQTERNFEEAKKGEAEDKKKKHKKDEVTKTFNTQKAWKEWKDKMQLYKTSMLLQTIGAIIKAQVLLDKDNEKENRDRIDIDERIQLFKLLDKNKKIVNFLTKKAKPKSQYRLTPQEQAKVSEFRNIANLNLEELNQRMEAINEYSKTIKETATHKRLMKAYDECVARKNDLIKEEENKNKQEMIKKHKLQEEKMKEEAMKQRQEAKDQSENEIGDIANQLINNPKEKPKRKEKPKNVEFDPNLRKKASKTPETEKTFLNQKYPSEREKNFTDKMFPPEVKSLCPTDEKGEFVPPINALAEDYEDWENINWERPEDIFKVKDYKVFEDNLKEDDSNNEIEVDDIIKGSYLSDEYFLSAVAALCPYPDFIKKLFYKKDKTSNDAYGVYLLINGEWKLVVLDDYLPTIKNKANVNHLCFTSARGNELWVPLLEKAWAKVNGSYINIGTGGEPHEVFPILTEAFSEKIQTPTLKEKKNKKREEYPFWDKLLRVEKQGFIMTATTNSSGNVEDLGLYSGHSYAINKLYDLYKETGKDIKLVNLRNALGPSEWCGDWGEFSKLWTPEIEKIVGKEEAIENGEFFMSFEDFCKYFNLMEICHFHLDYLYNVINVGKNNLNGPCLIKVEIPKDNCDAYFRVIQKNPRFKDWEPNVKETVPEYIMLLDDKFNYIISASNSYPTTCIRHPKLKKGIYYLLTDVNWRYSYDVSKFDEGYNVSAYSNEDIKLSLDKKNNPTEIMQKASEQIMDKLKKGEINETGLDLTETEYPKGDPLKKEKILGGKVDLLKSKSFSHRIPYQILQFENKSKEDIPLTIDIKNRGKKNFDFYGDDSGKEDSSKEIIIPKDGKKNLLIMKHDNNSIYSVGINESSVAKNLRAANPKKNLDEAVFNERPDPISEDGNVLQYYLENDDGYTIGIENKTRFNYDMKLTMEGLKLKEPEEYEGMDNASFKLPKNSKKVFNTEYVPNFNGETYFLFEADE